MRKIVSSLAVLTTVGCTHLVQASMPKVLPAESETLEVRVMYEEGVPASKEGIFCNSAKKSGALLLNAIRDEYPGVSFHYTCGGRWKSRFIFAKDVAESVESIKEMASKAPADADLTIGFTEKMPKYGGLVSSIGERFALVTARTVEMESLVKITSHEIGHMLGLDHAPRKAIMHEFIPFLAGSSEELIGSLREDEKKMIIEHLKALQAYNSIFHHKLYFPLEEKEKILKSVEFSKKLAPRIHFKFTLPTEDKLDIAQVHLKTTGSYTIQFSHTHAKEREDELKRFFETTLLLVPKESILFYTSAPSRYDPGDTSFISALTIPRETFLRYSKEILDASVSAKFLEPKDAEYLEKVVSYSKKWDINPYLVIYQEHIRSFFKGD